MLKLSSKRTTVITSRTKKFELLILLASRGRKCRAGIIRMQKTVGKAAIIKDYPQLVCSNLILEILYTREFCIYFNFFLC